MANYKNIKGFSIQYLDSDPPNPIEGQIWFNSTSGTFKGAEAGGVAAGNTLDVFCEYTSQYTLDMNGEQLYQVSV